MVDLNPSSLEMVGEADVRLPLPEPCRPTVQFRWCRRLRDLLALRVQPEGTSGTRASPPASDPQGHITWDLGGIKAIETALVQGDNNDDYIMSGHCRR